MLESSFTGYDNWKLASPYDNEVQCKDCGSEASENFYGRALCSECLKEY